ncbi:MAG: hypothetical protein GX495_19925 [Chloroflexi bacterium]|jgi:hypothetical protein|nr:hypothetical protein [Chloroflexota bacterium]
MKSRSSIRARVALSVILLPFLLSACNYPEQVIEETLAGLDPTAVFQTLAVRLTAEPTLAVDTESAPQTASPGTPTQLPTMASTDTRPPLPSRTLSPTPRCDLAAPGVPIDVTIPDDTQMEAEEPFTKIWRLVNAGSCTWTTEYSVELFSGDAMGAPRRFSLPKEVPPGASVDIAVDMNAPRKAGVYQGNWMLRNPSGGWFGIGPAGDAAFWVRIEVLPPPTDTPEPATNTPPPTVTLTLPPPAEPVSGALDLQAGSRVDLDSGQVDSGSGEDLQLTTADDSRMLFSTLEGAGLGVYGLDQPDAAACQAAAVGSAPVAVDTLEPGMYLCYRTDQGQPGYLLFISASQEGPSVRVEYVTWPAP